MAGCVAHPPPAPRWWSPVRLGRAGSAGRGRLLPAAARAGARRALALGRGDAGQRPADSLDQAGHNDELPLGSRRVWWRRQLRFALANRCIGWWAGTLLSVGPRCGCVCVLWRLLPVAGASASTGPLLPCHRVAGGWPLRLGAVGPRGPLLQPYALVSMALLDIVRARSAGKRLTIPSASCQSSTSRTPRDARLLKPRSSRAAAPTRRHRQSGTLEHRRCFLLAKLEVTLLVAAVLE